MTEAPPHPDGDGPANRLPVFEFSWHRCPYCRAARLAVRKSIAQGDGSTLRYYRCGNCDKHFKAILS